MSWPTIALKEESIVITKGTTPTSLGHEFTDNGVPFLRAQNLVDGTISVEADPLYISEDTNKVLKRSKIQPDDVLISIAGTIGRASIVPSNAREMNCNQAVAIVRPSEKVNRRFLLHWLSSRDAISQVSKGKVTGVISNLSLGQIGQLKVPLPPLDEQKRIAAILDHADALRRLRQRSVSVLKDMKTAVFNQMFPTSADTVPLGDIIKVGSGNGLTAKNMRGGDVPVYGGNGINGWHDEGFVDPRTVIIGRVGVYCGAVHITEKKAWVTDNALIVKKLVDIETDYLAEALRAANLNQYAGRSAQPLVSGSRIYPVQIPLPPIEAQQQFTSRAAVIVEKQAALQRSQDEMEALFASLQHRAFRGEL